MSLRVSLGLSVVEGRFASDNVAEVKFITAAVMSIILLLPIGLVGTASAQDQPKSKTEFVAGLLTVDDLAHVEPVSTKYRRQLLRAELDILIKKHTLTLTEAEQKAVIKAWLALLPTPSADQSVPNPAGMNGQSSRGSSLAPGSSGKRPPSDTGYRSCSSWRISAVAVTYGNGKYDTIHLDPSRLGTLFASTDKLYTDMYLCMHAEQHMTARVKSWRSIKQQLACHKVGWFAGTGPTWDLEGYRGEKSWWFLTAYKHKCNW